MRLATVTVCTIGVWAGCEPTSPPTGHLYDAARAPDGELIGMADGAPAHDATVLPDGAVVVVDATRIDARPPDAHVPDATPPDAGCAPGPTTAGFREVACGALAQERFGHEAVLLPDGRVALFGGRTPTAVSSTYDFVGDIEVYDPRTETFTIAAQLALPRAAHRATALVDGRVLVTGGHADIAPPGYHTATTEIFDPSSSTVTPGPTLNLARGDHTATLLADGRVLVTGGTTNVDPDDYSEGVAVAEVIDLVAGTATVVGAMAHERHEHEAARLPDGRVLLTGGADAPSCCDDGISAAELFDPATETFTATTMLLTPRPAHRTAALADGRILVTGGSVAHGGADGPTSVRSAELYDPTTETFVATGPMNDAPGSSHTMTLLRDGRVLIAGGLLGADAEIYDPPTAAFQRLAASMTTTRGGHTATRLLDGSVLIAGGRHTDTAEVFFP